MKQRAESDHISPTAYATGYFWYRQGLSHEAFAVPEGRRLDRGFRLLGSAIKLVGGFSIEALLLARHKGIDALLTQAIESGRVTQVVELAAGLSARGWRFTQKYGDRVTYVETDLPRMAELKRELLGKAGLKGPRHRVEVVDVLRDHGLDSLTAVMKSLNPAAGVAVVSEGLLSYLDPDTAKSAWRRIADALRGFPSGVYFSDCYVRQDRYGVGGALFRGAIQRFVRGRMHVHFETEAEAVTILRAAGFRDVRLHLPESIPETRELAKIRGGNRVRILQAAV
jgi:O-methyltransferase involved in polyketide biosynthesis